MAPPNLYDNLRTTLDFFYQWEEEKADEIYLRQPFGDNWKEITWREVGDQARRICSALQGMGFQKGDHIGIFSKNCYHWIITDLALMMGGFVSTPFYPNLNAEQLGQVLELSDAKALFVGKLDDWEGAKAGIPTDMPVIKFTHYPGNAKVGRGLEWENLLSQYEPVQGRPDMGFDDLWTVIFTSGTTGTPKGVMLPYKSPSLLIENERLHDNLGIFSVKQHYFLSYLPLNHIAERIIVEIASIMTGATVSFAESIDAFAKNLQQVQPTLFMSVPRLWSKFRLAILEKLPQKRLDVLLKVPVVKGMLKNKIKKGLGLNRAVVVLTGAAPTPDDLKNWYSKLDLTLQEVYGMTENCAGCTLMPKYAVKAGTVGRPLPNVEIRTDEATGEIIMRNPWMMTGYYKDEEKTKEVVRDGWIHTGDQGHLDKDGYLCITGRVKDTFKSAKGKYIIPAPIEWRFSKNPFIENIAVVGLGIPQPIALINLSDIGKAANKQEVENSLDGHLVEVNNALVTYQKVNSIIIIGEEWNIDNNILTPTMKIKRNELNRRYQNQYESWHDQPEKVIWS